MAEYCHLCAICGAVNPQLHHIDRNTENNVALNLLPLCPNHHLTDQHNPTRMIEAKRLRLFREYKDPAILKPQFEPLYRRLTALAANHHDFPELYGIVTDFLAFVLHLKMGEYYSERFTKLLQPAEPKYVSRLEPQHVDSTAAMEQGALFAQHANRINSSIAEVTRLTIELLRYQNWPAS